MTIIDEGLVWNFPHRAFLLFFTCNFAEYAENPEFFVLLNFTTIKSEKSKKMKKSIILIAAALMCGSAICGSASGQTVLKPHFTDASKKIVIPDGGGVSPMIHEGMITLHKYPQQMFVSVATGQYVFGTDFVFTRGNDRNSPYFSGGAMMGWRRKPDGYSNSPFIVYPDGKYRDLADVSNASSFCEGYALVQKGSSVIIGVKQTFIDKNGREVFPALASTQKGTFGDMNVYPVRENRRLYYNAELKKYGYADAKGTIVIKPQFEKGQNFSEGLAAVKVDVNGKQKWGFIDQAGKMVIPATYTLKPGRFSEGLAAVRIGDSESKYEMAYIDKTGARMMENQPWRLNEFHNGYAWVGTGCEKLFVMDKEYKEIRDLTKDFYHNGNGFGVCSFSMESGNILDKDWGFDFPGGTQALNQGGLEAGDIFAPDGTLLYHCVDSRDYMAPLSPITEGGLMFCKVRMIGHEALLKEKDVMLPCFINTKGEIVYYFVEGVEGYEGPVPVQVK